MRAVPCTGPRPVDKRMHSVEYLSRGDHRGLWNVSAFAFLGGSPQSILYDNTKLAVAKILGHGRRKRTRVHRVAVPLPVRGPVRSSRQGNDKGNVEGMVGYVPGADTGGGEFSGAE